MSSAVEIITLVCPKCQTPFETWHRASMSLQLDNFDAAYIREATVKTCPHCGVEIRVDSLIVGHDGVFRVGGDDSRQPRMENRMKLMTTSECIASEVNRLIPSCQQCWIAVAWASVGFDTFDLLVKHQSKIARMVVGTEFCQTHPQFLKAFLIHPCVRFLLKTDGVYHPKAYFFELADGHWECIIGSANFTRGGFGLNSEMAVLFDNTNPGAESVRTQFMEAMDGYWSMAKVLSESEYEAYAETWKLKQPIIKRLQGRFGDPAKVVDDRGKPPLEIPILQMSWQDFLAKVKNEQMTVYGHTAEKRVEMIEAVQQLFRSNSHFHEIEKAGRQRIAGTCGTQDGIDFGFFGSMIGAGKFKNAINENKEHVSRALDAIPASGRVNRDDYLRFVDEYTRGFTLGGGGTATATRLLAMKRPDVFVCLDQYNKVKLCEAFKIPYSVSFERYWDSIIERVMESRWWNSPQPLPNADRVERTVWMARTAFLDSLFYDPGRTEKPEYCTSFCIALPDGIEVLPFREKSGDGEFAFHVLEQGQLTEEAISVDDEDELRQYVVDLNCRVRCKQRDGRPRGYVSPLPPNRVHELGEV